MTGNPKPETPASRATTDEDIIKTSPEWLEKLSEKVDISPKGVIRTLRTQCSPVIKNERRDFTDEELAYFGSTAVKYDLNPFTREIYAFPKKPRGIQIIVPIDGWIKIINRRPDFNGLITTGLLKDQIGDYVEAKIHRRNIDHPFVVREYLHECQMDTIPWNKWPIRMLRHKAVIQCARYAFGLADIIDPDEAARHAIANVLEIVDTAPQSDKEHFQGPDGKLPEVAHVNAEEIPSRPKAKGVKQATAKAYNYAKSMAKDKGGCPDDETFKKFLEWHGVALPISHEDCSKLIEKFKAGDFSDIHFYFNFAEGEENEHVDPRTGEEMTQADGDTVEAPATDPERVQLLNNILDLKIEYPDIYDKAAKEIGGIENVRDLANEALDIFRDKMIEIKEKKEEKTKKKSSKK